MKMNFINKLVLVFVLIFIVHICTFSVYGAKGDPTLVNKLNTALKKIQGYLVKLAAPAARSGNCFWCIN